jgi:SAM-dependent methyltransferase
MTQHEDVSVTNDGERMIVINLWGYYAHLSIYRFAVPFCAGRRVLDAGSGVGYGSAYLSRHDAAVLAFDAAADAVGYASRKYAGDQVTYETADLNQSLPLGAQTFDVVVSSNVFEHVANVEGLTAECARVIKPDGVVIVAVPPINTAGSAEDDMRNQFHVHHIPPSAWAAKLSRFFKDVQCHAHLCAEEWRDRQRDEAAKPAAEVTIRETDFVFPPCHPDELEAMQSITAVFVCRNPRAEPMSETLAERTPLEWHESALAAKVIMEERNAAKILAAERDAANAACDAVKSERDAANAACDAVKSERDAANAACDAVKLERDAVAAEVFGLISENTLLRRQLADLHATTSWRVTAPLRRVVTAIRRR